MSKKDEALKLALEALEWINRVNAMEYEYKQKARESLNAIYDALAEQPAQQQAPVGVVNAMQEGKDFTIGKPWVGLTEDEINEVLGGDIRDEPSGALEFVRAIEAKLREKNA